ncbi:hypothetical protein AKO1_006264 [Acrasis kona]|uniref:Uncharacterized protein n=1 Tax=Acrasis kona TaxID=1008807 RepID=A0AAW2YHV7_9EUKA
MRGMIAATTFLLLLIQVVVCTHSRSLADIAMTSSIPTTTGPPVTTNLTLDSVETHIGNVPTSPPRSFMLYNSRIGNSTFKSQTPFRALVSSLARAKSIHLSFNVSDYKGEVSVLVEASSTNGRILGSRTITIRRPGPFSTDVTQIIKTTNLKRLQQQLYNPRIIFGLTAISPGIYQYLFSRVAQN